MFLRGDVFWSHFYYFFGPLLQLQGTFVAVGDEMSMKKLMFWIGSLDPTWVFRLDFSRFHLTRGRSMFMHAQ